MINEIEIKLWGETAGYAAYKDSELVYFEFSRNLDQRYDLSPLMMPRAQNKVWNFNLNEVTYHGLPGLLADSLPDRYGEQMISAYFLKQGMDLSEINSLDKLCYLGTRAMGALEFFPNQTTESKNKPIDIETLLDISAKILQEKIGIEANDEDLTRVIKMGSSAGGARAKAVIAINHKTGEIRSGQINQAGFESSIIKLDGLTNETLKDPQGYTNIEYAYYLMAKDCDIDISPSRLLEKDGRCHFITKRFDRTCDGSKLHLQTLCGLAHLDYNMPRLHSYETLFRVANRLELSMSEKEQIFKVMAFNVIGRNHDDHTKNFSFLMNSEGKWRLAPAYDLTYSYNPTNKWLKEHNLLINGKSSEIKIDDLMVYARTFHIKKAKDFIENISEVFSRWKDYAKEAQVDKDRIKEIGKNIVLLS